MFDDVFVPIKSNCFDFTINKYKLFYRNVKQYKTVYVTNTNNKIYIFWKK